MKAVSFFSLKGGVGKTTLSVNIAACLARDGFMTLFMDLEGLSATNYIFDHDEVEIKVRRGLAELLSSRLRSGMFALHPSDIIIRSPERWCGHLDIMPGGKKMADIDAEAARYTLGERRNLLRDLLGLLGDRYEFVVMDCPPGPGLSCITRMAIDVSDALIVPMTPDYMSFLRALATIDEADKMPAKPASRGVVFNRVPHSGKEYKRTIADAREELSRRGVYVFKTVIGEYVAYPMSFSQHVPLPEVRDSRGSKASYERAIGQFIEFYREFKEFLAGRN